MFQERNSVARGNFQFQKNGAGQEKSLLRDISWGIPFSFDILLGRFPRLWKNMLLAAQFVCKNFRP